MKKILFAIFAMAITLTACGQNNNKNTKDDMKTLIAYFSATGTTEAVAKDLAAVTSGTLHEIKPEVKYTSADLDWTVKSSRSSVEMQDRSSRPAIMKDLKDADSYDLIYIGFPVWWYTAPTIINSKVRPSFSSQLPVVAASTRPMPNSRHSILRLTGRLERP